MRHTGRHAETKRHKDTETNRDTERQRLQEGGAWSHIATCKCLAMRTLAYHFSLRSRTCATCRIYGVALANPGARCPTPSFGTSNLVLLRQHQSRFHDISYKHAPCMYVSGRTPPSRRNWVEPRALCSFLLRMGTPDGRTTCVLVGPVAGGPLEEQKAPSPQAELQLDVTMGSDVRDVMQPMASRRLLSAPRARAPHSLAGRIKVAEGGGRSQPDLNRNSLLCGSSMAGPKFDQPCLGPQKGHLVSDYWPRS